MTSIVHYLVLAFAWGAIGLCASENLFWSAPPDDLTLRGWLMTWGAYAIAAAVALSAVIATGCGGWRGLFLGAAIGGFMIEGVIVDTMYEAFPFQLVWTPLAWHALLTGLAVGGLGRMAGRWKLHRLVMGWTGLGLIFGAMALYWPVERPVLPGTGAVVIYLCGGGLLLPAANLMLDRAGGLPRPPEAVLLVVPALATLLWTAKLVADPQLQRLALPVMVGATLWAMARLGQRHRPVGLGRSAPAWRHALALLCPVVTGVIALTLWPVTGGLSTNIPVALLTSALGLGLWLWLLGVALWRPAHPFSA